jgi:hypothetical protein
MQCKSDYTLIFNTFCRHNNDPATKKYSQIFSLYYFITFVCLAFCGFYYARYGNKLTQRRRMYNRDNNMNQDTQRVRLFDNGFNLEEMKQKEKELMKTVDMD